MTHRAFGPLSWSPWWDPLPLLISNPLQLQALPFCPPNWEGSAVGLSVHPSPDPIATTGAACCARTCHPKLRDSPTAVPRRANSPRSAPRTSRCVQRMGGQGSGDALLGWENGEGILFTHLQKCERVLLELLCHEPCRPLHRLSSSTVSAEPTGISCVGFPLLLSSYPILFPIGEH